MDITVQPIYGSTDLKSVQPIGRPVYRPTYASNISDPYSMTSEQWKAYSCSRFPDQPYAVESIMRRSTHVEDRGVDWNHWYYLFVLSLPRRKVVVEETSYYERDLYCDGSKSEERLVITERRDLEEYNQASLFGIEGYLEWTSITVGAHITIGDREYTYTEDSRPDEYGQTTLPAPNPNDPTRNLETPILGEEHFADIPVRERQDRLYYHLYDGTIVNYVLGDELSWSELPDEFRSRSAGLDAQRYKIVDVKVSKVYDDRPSDRYTYRVTVREMVQRDRIFAETTVKPE